jgi:pilus assembly protein CpaC
VHRYLALAVMGLSFILGGTSNSAQPVSPTSGPATVPSWGPAPVGEAVNFEQGSTAQIAPTGTSTLAEAGKGALISPTPDPAAAAGLATPAPSPTATGPGVATEIPPSGKPIVLEAGKGTLIRLPRPASTVFIANPDVADVQIKSPSLIYVNAKAPGETVLYAVDAEDHVLVNAPVRVGHDLSRLRQSLSAVAPGENVNISSIDNQLFLTGKVATAGDAQKVNALAKGLADETKGRVVNELSVAAPNQVNLRVKIAEVSRDVMKFLGFNLSKLAGNIQFQTLGASPSVATPPDGDSVFQFVIGGHNARVLTTIDALASEGLVTVLAEPNLTTTSGQPAFFQVGGQTPIPIAQPGAGGVTSITIEFKDFGVILHFTPTIIDPYHISLRVLPEVSEPDFANAITVAGTTIPSFTQRRADTTVELGSGQSFALAGLLQNNSTQNVNKVPGLGDIPILGQLFRSERFQRHETDLVIIVTPYIVKPAATAVSAPTDGFIAPHDVQRFINGDTYRQTLPPPGKGPLPPDGQGLIGPVGFRLD